MLDDLKDRKLITNEEILRLIYRFFGETIDADEMLKKAAAEKGRQGKLPEVNTTGVPKVKGFNPSDKKIEPEKDKTIKNLEELG